MDFEIRWYNKVEPICSCIRHATYLMWVGFVKEFNRKHQASLLTCPNMNFFLGVGDVAFCISVVYDALYRSCRPTFVLAICLCVCIPTFKSLWDGFGLITITIARYLSLEPLYIATRLMQFLKFLFIIAVWIPCICLLIWCAIFCSSHELAFGSYHLEHLVHLKKLLLGYISSFHNCWIFQTISSSII